MSITTKQFDQLTEMGIDLWQGRTSCCIDDTKQYNFITQSQQNVTNLTKKKLFSDILRSLNLTIGEVKAQDDHLDVGLFNWYFLNKNLDENQKNEPVISFINNKLISPDIETIAQSTNLKKQLWHTIANNLL